MDLDDDEFFAAAMLETQGQELPPPKAKKVKPDFVEVYGPDAKASVEIVDLENRELAFMFGREEKETLLLKDQQKKRTKRQAKSVIRAQDLGLLIKWVLGETTCPTWVFVRNKPLIDQIVVIALPGMGDGDICCDYFAAMEKTREAMKGATACSVRSSGTANKVGEVTEGLLTIPMHRAVRKKRSRREKKSVKELRKEVKRAQCTERVVDPEELLLGEQDFRNNGYPPFPLSNGGWKAIPEDPLPESEFFHLPCQHRGSKDPLPCLFAMDCEMVQTTQGLELARVSVVKEEGGKEACKVLDMLVKPRHTIVDYLTQFSGIDASILRNVNHCLEDAQQAVAQLWKDPRSILVGHGLENDLWALRMVCKRVIDTSLVYAHPKGPPYKNSLRGLAQRHLGKEIQKRKQGHDSVEDAVAALDLVRLKLVHGVDFGCIERETALLVDDLEGKRCVLIDAPGWARMFVGDRGDVIEVATDAECVRKACGVLRSSLDFMWVRLTSIPKPLPFALGDPKNAPLEKEWFQQMEQVDAYVAKMVRTCPPKTLVLLWTGHGDKEPLRILKEKCAGPDDIRRKVVEVKGAACVMHVL